MPTRTAPNPQPLPSVAVRRPGRTLAQALVEAFAAKIAAGACTPGDKLPTEAEVAAEFGVSRSVVREAMSRLDAMGLAVTRHGIGTFVAAPRPGTGKVEVPTAGAMTIPDVLAMLEFRAAVEVEAAGLAAARRSRAQLARIERAITELEHAVASGTDAIASDFEFHFQIAAATGNQYFERALARLDRSAIPRTRLDTARMSAEPLTAYLQRLNLEHRAIVDAIARRDTDASRAAMRVHLANSMERLRAANTGDERPVSRR